MPAGHGDAAVQVLHHNGAAQEAAEDLVIAPVVGDEGRGDAYKPGLVLHPLLPQFLSPDGRQGQEGGPAPVPLLEEGDGGFGILLPVHHDVLHPGPQGGLQGHGTAAGGLHEVGRRAVDAPQGPLPGALHHKAHRLVEPLVLPLHLRQEPDTGGEVVLLHRQRLQEAGGVLRLFLPARHAQRVALDDVANAPCLLLRLREGTAGGRDLLPGALLLGPGGGKLPGEGPLTLLHLLQPRREGG